MSRTYTVAGHSRLTLDVGVEFPSSVGLPSTAVVTGSVPVIVEASRYWDAGGVRWSAGVNLVATPIP